MGGMTGDLIVLWLAALPLMGSPGPATMSLAAVGAAYGARPGLGYLAGIVAGTTGVLLLIATGVTGLILAEPALVRVITVLAAVYILYLAYRIATAPVLAGAGPETAAPSFPGGFLLAIANPKAFAAIGAVYGGHTILEGDPLLDAAAKIAALAAVIVVVNAAWLVFGAALSSVLRDPRIGRIANIAFAVLLVASVALAVFAG